MLLKDMDVATVRSTPGTRARGVRFLTGDDHPCCLHFSVQEYKNSLPNLERVGFFLFESFRPISRGVWLPRCSSRHLEYSLSLAFLLSVCQLMALSHSCLLDMHDPHKPNGIRNAASVISQVTWRSLDI